MYRFWESMLFRTGNYQGAPFPKHAVLPVEQAHFERWVMLFVETVNENFSGEGQRLVIGTIERPDHITSRDDAGQLTLLSQSSFMTALLRRKKMEEPKLRS